MLRRDQAARLLHGMSRSAVVTGIVRLFEWSRRGSLTVLRLRLSPTATEAEGDGWTPQDLTAALQLVAQRYRVLNLDEVASALHNGTNLPESSLVVTASLTLPPRDFRLERVLEQAGVYCLITGAPELLDRGMPPWPMMVREAIRCTKSDSIDMYDRRWSTGDPANRITAAREIIARIYALPDADRSARAEELVRSWGVDPHAVEGIQWTDFERLANNPWVSIGTRGLSGDSLVRLPADRAIWELRESRYRMSERLGREIIHCEFPWGETSPLIETEAAKAGYKTGISWRATQGKTRTNPDPLRLVSRPLHRGTTDYMRADLAGVVSYMRPVVRALSKRRLPGIQKQTNT
jgi:hypothetical protein